MSRSMITGSMVAFVVAVAVPASATTIVVPSSADPWLAGMPNGTGAEVTDIAPAQSPVQAGISLPPGGWLEFFNATGTVGNELGGGPTVDFPAGPEGHPTEMRNHLNGPQNSIGDTFAPINALMGVFLDSSVPSGAAPWTTVFETAAERDYLSIAPLLNQVFFIGDGQTGTAMQQQVFIPFGATRLFLGTMDQYDWNNNYGSFSVEVRAVPEPMTLAVLSLGAGAMVLKRRRFRA